MRLVKKDDSTFDLFLNRELHQEAIHEDGLVNVCARFGYCQDEFTAILCELNQTGVAQRGPF
jgi:hypothetical protein